MRNFSSYGLIENLEMKPLRKKGWSFGSEKNGKLISIGGTSDHVHLFG